LSGGTLQENLNDSGFFLINLHIYKRDFRNLSGAYAPIHDFLGPPLTTRPLKCCSSSRMAKCDGGVDPTFHGYVVVNGNAWQHAMVEELAAFVHIGTYYLVSLPPCVHPSPARNSTKVKPCAHDFIDLVSYKAHLGACGFQ
jgi:hypothetical protein